MKLSLTNDLGQPLIPQEAVEKVKRAIGEKSLGFSFASGIPRGEWLVDGDNALEINILMLICSRCHYLWTEVRTGYRVCYWHTIGFPAHS